MVRMHDGEHLPGLPRSVRRNRELGAGGEPARGDVLRHRDVEAGAACGMEGIVLTHPLGIPDLLFVALVAVRLVGRHALEEGALVLEVLRWPWRLERQDTVGVGPARRATSARSSASARHPSAG